jgi:hypothetical protein
MRQIFVNLPVKDLERKTFTPRAVADAKSEPQ